MAAASGLDKFRFVDDLAKLDPDAASAAAMAAAAAAAAAAASNAVNGNEQVSERRPSALPSSNTAAAAAAAAAASRLLSLQRDLGGGPAASPMDFLKQLEASSRGSGRGGFDRLMSLAGFGFPGLTGLPPLTSLHAPPSDDRDLQLHDKEEDTTVDHRSHRLSPESSSVKRGKSLFLLVEPKPNVFGFGSVFYNVR